MSRTREEMETIIRWDGTPDEAFLWTASPRQAARWRRQGYTLTDKPGGWALRAPKAAIRPLRRLVDGQVVRRKGGSSSAALVLARAARRNIATMGLRATAGAAGPHNWPPTAA